MFKVKLSPRMKLLIEHGLKGDVFWDVCCDHGLIGLGAAESLNFTEIHFVDQIAHIMDRLQRNARLQFDDHAQTPLFFYTSAAQDLALILKGTVVIAGVGGFTIKTIILALLRSNRLLASRLLLSAYTDEKVLIECINLIQENGLYVLKEKIEFVENNKSHNLYVIDKVIR